MHTFHDTFEVGLNVTLVLLLLADLCYNMYRIGKKKAEATLPRIDVYLSAKERIDFQDTKAATNSATVIKEVTDSLEAISLDKSKKVLLEISNGVAGGFVVKTKFGSS